MVKLLLVLIPSCIFLGSCGIPAQENNDAPKLTSESSPTESSDTPVSPEPSPTESSEVPESSPPLSSKATSSQVTEASVLGCWSRTTESFVSQYTFSANGKFATAAVFPELAQVTSSSGSWSLKGDLIILTGQVYPKSLRLISPDAIELSPGSGDIYKRCET